MQTVKVNLTGKMNIKFGGGAKCHRDCDPLEEKVFRMSLCLSRVVLLRRETNLDDVEEFFFPLMLFRFCKAQVAL